MRPPAPAPALWSPLVALTTLPPFAPPEPDASGDGKLSRHEELKRRQDAIAEMMRGAAREAQRNEFR